MELTLSDKKDRLRQAVRNSGKGRYLIDATDSWLVYETYDSDQEQYLLYRVSYSLDGEGNVALGNDKVQVRQRVVYDDVTGSDSAELVEVRARPRSDAASLRARLEDLDHAAFSPCEACKTPRVCSSRAVCALES